MRAMPEENLERARRLVELFNSGERKELERMMVEEPEIVPLRAALEGTVYRGPDATDQFWAAIDESWETVQMTPEEITEHDERVLIVGRLLGKARETGMELDAPMAWLMRFEDGRVASIRAYVSVTEGREAAEMEGDR
jgi:ketosteroid isomerase-like protein